MSRSKRKHAASPKISRKNCLRHYGSPSRKPPPKHGFVYKANYGFLPGTVSGDGEEIDAYVLNIDRPLQNYTGKCTAVIHRTDDNDDKLIIIPQEDEISDLEIETQTAFQEKWFKHIIIRKIPAIHLICGFIGFGKTTYAKRLEQELPAVRFTHDEIMCARYGRSPEDFPEKYKLTDKEIRRDAAAEISRGHNVILDYGFWSKKTAGLLPLGPSADAGGLFPRSSLRPEYGQRTRLKEECRQFK